MKKYEKKLMGKYVSKKKNKQKTIYRYDIWFTLLNVFESFSICNIFRYKIK